MATAKKIYKTYSSKPATKVKLKTLKSKADGEETEYHLILEYPNGTHLQINFEETEMLTIIENLSGKIN